ncbi:MAG: outer membrane homotrimeric porin [Desulfovibrionaceae bacterium]|nr:outer membrane homotrimeric porin [Desulfovibrionaceae bacterium]
MKKIMTLLLTAAMVCGAAAGAQAVDFKVSGQWIMGFGVGDASLVNKTRDSGVSKKASSADKFSAQQRVRVKLEAVASENLSGTVWFEMGNTRWGQAKNSGALGADDTCVKVKNAYIDWAVPDTDLKLRMGIQAISMPNAAGGSAIFDDDMAAVTVNYKFNENIGLTMFWARPVNDNYAEGDWTGSSTSNDKSNYLDNLDLIFLSVPMTFDGLELTPWVMYGIVGQNALKSVNGSAGHYYSTFLYSDFGYRFGGGQDNYERNSKAYTSAFWAGLPVKVSLLDPVNIEFDFNYGYVESVGRGTLETSSKRWDTRREGWLAKALVEYKMDWGTPGIYGWYASGDDDNPKNGSERMPSVSPAGSFSTFMGDGGYAWASDSTYFDRNLGYSGTWGIGLRVSDMSFVENLTHTFRVAYWGGTNSPSMAKYAQTAYAWASYSDYDDSADPELYLTTNDAILEFGLVNEYQMYENFAVNLELGYLVNFIDQDTWKKAGTRQTGFDSKDAWKAHVTFVYSF